MLINTMQNIFIHISKENEKQI